MAKQPYGCARRREVRLRRGDRNVSRRHQLAAGSCSQTVHSCNNGDRQEADQLHERLASLEDLTVVVSARLGGHLLKVVAGGEDATPLCPQHNGADGEVLSGAREIADETVHHVQGEGVPSLGRGKGDVQP